MSYHNNISALQNRQVNSRQIECTVLFYNVNFVIIILVKFFFFSVSNLK